MDRFIKSVTDQTFKLHPVDTQAAFLNIPYHFFYPNTDGTTNTFMPSATLKDGFYLALAHFPILAGHLETDSRGQTCINIDSSKLNIPEYAESTSNVHFDSLRKSRFHWSSWPQGLSTAGAFTKANADGVIKLLSVHVVRLKDNSGVVIFANMPHYAVDGTGLFAFMELWGRMCADPTYAVEATSFEFDRAIIAQSIASAGVACKPLDPEMVRVYTGFNPIADLLAWLSPKTRAWVLAKGQASSTDVSSAKFRVTRDQLAALSAQVFNYMDCVDDTHVLAALVAMVVAQAHKRNESSKGNNVMALNLLSDLRKSLGIVDRNYMGNGLIPFSSECPLSTLEEPICPESLAQATQLVSRVYENVDAGLVASFVDMITTKPKSFMRPAVYLATNPTALVITNETKFKLYAADFGCGTPEWVCSLPSFAANFVGFLPAPAPSTDIVVNITLKTPVLEHVVANEVWQSLATKIY
ncbi:hypothetical protein EV175_003401 [Coemansia sp. RSA 1933]|nr:hypothetical protein EV175_003401 [Coemansia sp. RSA 1933]